MNYFPKDKEFQRYAQSEFGLGSNSIDAYSKQIQGSMTPYILEERELRATQMDIFSRLMMDRVIFMGVPVNDYVANVIQAQLLFLESTDPKMGN